MEIAENRNDIFVRLDPGEQLIGSLKQLARELNVKNAAITSGLGMIDGAVLGFFDIELDDYRTSSFQGVFDLSMVMGNLSWNDAEPIPHVHLVFNDTSYRMFSGHLIEATSHITMEIFLQRCDELNLARVKVAGCPASRLIPGAAGIAT